MATSAERIKKTKIALNFIYQHMIKNKTSVDQIVYEDDQAGGGGREDQEDWMRAAEEAREEENKIIERWKNSDWNEELLKSELKTYYKDYEQKDCDNIKYLKQFKGSRTKCQLYIDEEIRKKREEFLQKLIREEKEEEERRVRNAEDKVREAQIERDRIAEEAKLHEYLKSLTYKQNKEKVITNNFIVCLQDIFPKYNKENDDFNRIDSIIKKANNNDIQALNFVYETVVQGKNKDYMRGFDTTYSKWIVNYDGFKTYVNNTLCQLRLANPDIKNQFSDYCATVKKPSRGGKKTKRRKKRVRKTRRYRKRW